eukprot:3370662-Rhodomonas_salina.3
MTRAAGRKEVGSRYPGEHIRGGLNSRCNAPGQLLLKDASMSMPGHQTKRVRGGVRVSVLIAS